MFGWLAIVTLQESSKHGHLLSVELPFYIMISHGQWLDLLKKRLDLLKIFFVM